MRDSNQPAWSTIFGDSPIDLVVIKPRSEPAGNDLSPAIARGKLIRTLKNVYFLIDNRIIMKYSIRKGMLSWLIKIEIRKGSEVRKWYSL
jgi:hypothetical protein